MSSPQWILQPLQGTGSEEKGGDKGALSWGLFRTARPHQAELREGNTFAADQGRKPLVPFYATPEPAPSTTFLFGGLHGAYSWEEDPTRELLIIL